MARIRTIKPEFFTDEDIAKLPPLTRIAFQGLCVKGLFYSKEHNA
jgi:hypothetical protein